MELRDDLEESGDEEGYEEDINREAGGTAASIMATRARADSTLMFESTGTPLDGSRRRRSTGRRKMKKQTTLEEMNV